jgi:hypothetical protein
MIFVAIVVPILVGRLSSKSTMIEAAFATSMETLPTSVPTTSGPADTLALICLSVKAVAQMRNSSISPFRSHLDVSTNVDPMSHPDSSVSPWDDAPLRSHRGVEQFHVVLTIGTDTEQSSPVDQMQLYPRLERHAFGPVDGRGDFIQRRTRCGGMARVISPAGKNQLSAGHTRPALQGKVGISDRVRRIGVKAVAMPQRFDSLYSFLLACLASIGLVVCLTRKSFFSICAFFL